MLALIILLKDALIVPLGMEKQDVNILTKQPMDYFAGLVRTDAFSAIIPSPEDTVILSKIGIVFVDV